MSIISWNVNGIRAIHKKGFLDWLMKEDPDIICLQENKAQKEQVDNALINPGSYHTFWAQAQKKGYSGVTTYSKIQPLKISQLGIEEFDAEGRVLIMHFEAYVLINAYFPNSQEKGKRIDYKIAFCNALLKSCQDFVKKGLNVILCGDYNIAHKAIDLKHPEDNENNPGYLPAEREWMDTFVNAGFVDVFRIFNQEPDQYTWWSYRTRARERNAGWRIDYHFVNESFKKQIHSCTIMNDVKGSDHCPIKIELKT